MAAHYRRPGWFTKRIFNGVVNSATRLGVSVMGSRILEVRGRKTGQPRRVPVNLLEISGERFLVAPPAHDFHLQAVGLHVHTCGD